MSSSISSSRTALLAFGFGLLFVGVVEFPLRVAGTRLSRSLAHLAEIPEIVERLAAEKAPRLLVLGNSLVREGVEEQQLERELSAAWGQEVAAALVHPDDTSVLEWVYLVESGFGAQQIEYEALIVGFARDQLADQQWAFEERARIAAITPWSGLVGVVAKEELQFGQAAELFLSKAFRSFALREAVQKRVLDGVIPWYRETVQHINDVMRADSVSAEGKSTARTYRYLDRLIEAADDQGTDLVLVAMPIREPYSVRKEIRKIVDNSDALFLDLAAGLDFAPDDFIDPLHLSISGSERFTRRLAESLLLPEL